MRVHLRSCAGFPHSSLSHTLAHRSERSSPISTPALSQIKHKITVGKNNKITPKKERKKRLKNNKFLRCPQQHFHKHFMKLQGFKNSKASLLTFTCHDDPFTFVDVISLICSHNSYWDFFLLRISGLSVAFLKRGRADNLYNVGILPR